MVAGGVVAGPQADVELQDQDLIPLLPLEHEIDQQPLAAGARRAKAEDITKSGVCMTRNE